MKRRVRACTTAAATLVALLTVVGCAGSTDSQQPPETSPQTGDTTPASGTTAATLSALIDRQARAWLDGFAALQPLQCASSPVEIQTTDSRVQACVAPAQDFTVRVRNRAEVPISVWGFPASNVFTVAPQATLDIVLSNPQYGQFLNFRADAYAGVGLALIEEVDAVVEERRLGGMSWVTCPIDPDPDCLVDTLLEQLPEEVTVFGRRVPLQTVADALTMAYQNRDLIRAFGNDLSGSSPGRLTILQRPA